ncbi:uncharacterized protein FPRO_11797 [Fusarium proliferatum ET1]|uniref:Uncharacterized protein n=1 Tax=Fusarium proliferatum (strain ET1) TaxID=1227346 RepID=A0A1L7W112_FUSPR|nr:uncharacterized protein FPRO_11797 [Fusarium proliferatum ET1]CZR46349.1 uncharacterized protein FPRO_11797 [Fusarium proliferatum ET1]
MNQSRSPLPTRSRVLISVPAQAQSRQSDDQSTTSPVSLADPMSIFAISASFVSCFETVIDSSIKHHKCVLDVRNCWLGDDNLLRSGISQTLSPISLLGITMRCRVLPSSTGSCRQPRQEQGRRRRSGACEGSSRCRLHARVRCPWQSDSWGCFFACLECRAGCDWHDSAGCDSVNVNAVDTLFQGLGKARCNFEDQSNEAVTDDIEIAQGRCNVSMQCHVFLFHAQQKGILVHISRVTAPEPVVCRYSRPEYSDISLECSGLYPHPVNRIDDISSLKRNHLRLVGSGSWDRRNRTRQSEIGCVIKGVADGARTVLKADSKRRNGMPCQDLRSPTPFTAYCDISLAILFTSLSCVQQHGFARPLQFIPTRSTDKRQQRRRRSGHEHHETQLYSIEFFAADFSLSSPTRQFTHFNNALFLGTLNASPEPNPTVQAHHARTGFSLSLSVRVSPQKELLGVHHLFCLYGVSSFQAQPQNTGARRKTSVAALSTERPESPGTRCAALYPHIAFCSSSSLWILDHPGA